MSSYTCANAYSVAMGKSSCNTDYDQSRMRSHLEECFEEELSRFPLSSVPVKRSRLKHLLQFTAFVRGQKGTMTWWSVKAVVATWFHFKCVGLCSSSNTDNWKCSTCSMY